MTQSAIVKVHGKGRQISFTCPRCSCEFEADNRQCERTMPGAHRSARYSHKCPDCRTFAVEENWFEDVFHPYSLLGIVIIFLIFMVVMLAVSL